MCPPSLLWVFPCLSLQAKSLFFFFFQAHALLDHYGLWNHEPSLPETPLLEANTSFFCDFRLFFHHPLQNVAVAPKYLIFSYHSKTLLGVYPVSLLWLPPRVTPKSVFLLKMCPWAPTACGSYRVSIRGPVTWAQGVLSPVLIYLFSQLESQALHFQNEGFMRKFYLFITCFWPCCEAYETLVLWPGMEFRAQQWEHWILTTGWPGNSHRVYN